MAADAGRPEGIVGHPVMRDVPHGDLPESTPAAIIGIDAAGRITFVSASAEELFGYSRKELLRQPSEMLAPERLRDEHQLRRGHYLHGELSQISESTLVGRRKDGSEFTAEVAFALVGGNDAGVSTVAVMRDVADRRGDESARREHERRLRGAFDEAPAGMCLVSMDKDSAGHYMAVNQAFCKLLGYTEEELLELSFQAITHPDDVERSVDAMRGCISGEIDSWQADKRYVRKDGQPIWAHITASIVRDENGTAQYAVTQVLDINERRREQDGLRCAEMEMRGAFEEGPVGRCLVSIEDGMPGSFVRVNDALCEMSGYAEGELLGADLRKLAYEEEVETIIGDVRELLDGSRASLERELRMRRSSGEIAWVQVSAAVSRDEGREPLFLIGQAQDITARKRAEQELIRTLSLHAATVESTADGILVVDRSGGMTSFNQHFVAMWGLPCEIMEARDDDRALQFVLDQLKDPEGFLRKVRELYDDLTAESFDVLEFKDGRIFERYSKPQLIDGEPAGRVWSFRDVTERKRVERELREAEAKHRLLVERLPAITYVVEQQGPNSRWHFVSPQVRTRLGYSVEEWKADPTLWLRSVHPDDRAAVVVEDTKSISTGEFSLDYRMFTREGELVWFHDEGSSMPGRDGEPALIHGFMLDITERKRSEERLSFLAYHDGLTGLPNRAMFQEHLELAVARARRHERAVAVLYMDLDRFKLVNDSFGHAPGDELLRQIADRLRSVTRADDLVARHSGDEFLVMLADIEARAGEEDSKRAIAQAAEMVAEKIHGALQAPFVVEGEEFFVDASVGVGICPTDAEDADTLMRHADMAMYKSKRLGRGGTQVYARAGIADPAAQLSLASRLRRATERKEFELLYQPIVELASCEIKGLEALIRWRDPTRGLIMPRDFIPLAEETEMIERIGDWVIAEVCAQAAQWERLGLTVSVGFNVSLRQLRRPDFAKRLMEVAGAAGADPTMLVVEITESAVMRDPDQTREVLRELRACGMSTAIDDFGTGHSSLSRLVEVPVTSLKIDRSFIEDVPANRGAAAMTAGIVQIARGLDLNPVAEGIETEDQRRFLLDAGCAMGQGFRFSRPVRVDRVLSLWKAGPLLAPAQSTVSASRRRRFGGAARASERLH